MENNQGLDEAFSSVKLEIIARGNAEDHYVQFHSLRTHRFGKKQAISDVILSCDRIKIQNIVKKEN